MSSPPRRSYTSGLRSAQAEATRQTILSAAERVAGRSGWSGATMPAIAAEAGVAKETLYAVFGSKPALIAEMVRARVGLSAGFPPEITGEADLTRQIALWSGWLTEVLARVAPLMALLRSGAEAEPEMARLYAELHAGRRSNLGAVAAALVACGPLRPGMTAETVTDLLWHLASPELFTLSTTVGGQGAQAFAARLTGLLTRALVPDPPVQ